MPKATRQAAEKIVDGIIADLEAHPAMGNKWSLLADEQAAQTRADWIKIVRRILKAALKSRQEVYAEIADSVDGCGEQSDFAAGMSAASQRIADGIRNYKSSR